MIRYFPLAALLFATPTLAQQAPSPDAQKFASTHQLAVCQQDDSAMASTVFDLNTQLQAAQKQIAALQAQLATANALPCGCRERVGAQTFTNSPCTGLTTEKRVPISIRGQSGTFYVSACQ